MAAGALVHSAVIPGGAPPGLVTQFKLAAASRGRLADGAAVTRYAWGLTDGRTVEAWVIPTARSDLAIICSAPRVLTAALRQCAAMATRARVSGVPLLAIGRDVRLAHSLQRAAGDANGSRHALAVDHSGWPWPSGKVTSAVSADTRVTKSLRELAVPPRYGHIVSGLAAAFTAEANALKGLAHADQARDSKQYARASKAITQADHGLKTVSGQATRAGLLRTAFSGLKAPAWPVVAPTQAPTGSGNPSLPSTTTTTNPTPSYTPTPTPTPTPAPSKNGGGGGSASASGSGSGSGGNQSSVQPVHG